ncbi:MAG TPA: tRNA guanosine(34) transglycosylase Tgt [Candidatus Avalokitesvara rifleensis]|uniref:tRNA guanosine(34) transglycosylase Tgt n=1 Tax=Candidatus Avalokitesvara rifleensis TaxID=3367620 RepID=UPI004028025F
MRFRILRADNRSKARCGEMETSHGTVKTPVFMPVGTQATVKTLTPVQLRELGVEAIICNAYHLSLRPGEQIVKDMGGIHRFMGWDRTIVTDSGGYQVFSLRNISRTSDEGVEFSSPFTGERIFFSPERVIDIQIALGSDIMMPFDQCVPYPCERDDAKEAMLSTDRWTRRCLAALSKRESNGQALFGIVQGSVFRELRQESVERLGEMDLDGYAVGGLSVGEGRYLMNEVLGYTVEKLPWDKPRYLMGVGSPADILDAVEHGVDIFDCVLPTRNGRNGCAFTKGGKIKLFNSIYREDKRPLDDTCDCYTCRTFSRAYLRHLFFAGEILALTLVSLHNVRFFQEMMRGIREAVLAGTFVRFKEKFLEVQEKEDSK